MQEVPNILKIFQQAKTAIEKDDSAKLRELSDQTINTASRTHDPDNIATAVIIYALGKTIERPHYRKEKTWAKFYKNILLYINALIAALKENNEQKIRKNLQNIRSSISGLSGNLKKYIEDVFLKAKINKASKIYEHGISMETTASLLGITMYELALYSGQKPDGEAPAKKITVQQRIKFAEEIFA